MPAQCNPKRGRPKRKAPAEVELVLRASRMRWIPENSFFWQDFVDWVFEVVKPSATSNLIKFSVCCWSFQFRKQGGYLPNHEMVTFTKKLSNKAKFLEYFKTIAGVHGFRKRRRLFIPSIDSPHLDSVDDPGYNFTPFEDEIKVVEVPHIYAKEPK